MDNVQILMRSLFKDLRSDGRLIAACRFGDVPETRFELGSGRAALSKEGASHFLWSGRKMTNLPIEQVGPMFVFNAAFDGEQRAGARFRPETPNPAQPRKMGCTHWETRQWMFH